LEVGNEAGSVQESHFIKMKHIKDSLIED